MRRFNIACTIGGVAIAALSLSACVTRTENLDNLNVITKPYSLLFADEHGTLYSTYDGSAFSVLATSSGVPVMGLATTDKYILMRPNPGILTVDDGGEGRNHNFNPTYFNVNPFSFGPSFVLNIPDYSDTGAVKRDRIYLASDKNGGLAYNDSNAQTKTSWYFETDTALTGSVTSLTQLDNGAIIAFDDIGRTVDIKVNLGTLWRSQSAQGLPGAGTGRMFVISMKNDIYAVMTADPANGGVWRSTDQGHTFSQLPTGPTDITCAIGAFDKVLIVGTQSGGVYRLSGQGAWESSSIGLKSGIIIYGLAYKSNKFKNGKSGEYIFAATNDGVYRSDNLGQNWVRLDIPTMKQVTAIY